MINLIQVKSNQDDPVNEVGPVPQGTGTPHYKLVVLWDHFVPQVKSRAVSDVLAIAKIADTNRIPFVVATDEELGSVLRNLGITVTDNMMNPHLTRVYLTDGDTVPFSLSERVKDTSSEVDYVSINVQRADPPDEGHGYNIADPYSGIVYPKLWHRIPETLPIDRAPPRGTSEPMWSPFL